MTRVLVIGDVHEPACHPGYMAFCQSLAEKWDTDRVVFIGDILDMHCISFHAKEPDAPGAEDEAQQTFERVRRWHDAFSPATVTIGNHDARVYRLGASVSIPPRFIKGYSEAWDTPKWKWVQDITIDKVHYIHQGGGGMAPALAAVKKALVSVVCGHNHCAGGVHYISGPNGVRLFGLDTGCGIDEEHAAMRYGKGLWQRPNLGAGVVIDGVGYYEPMPSGRGEPFHRSKFRGKR